MCYYNGIKVTESQLIRLLDVERQLLQMELFKPVQNGFYSLLVFGKNKRACCWC